MTLILRLGDPGSHGGVMTTSASKSYAEGILIVRKGDTYSCPIHGDNPLAEGCAKSWCEGHKIGHDGHHATCGAVISATATKTHAE